MSEIVDLYGGPLDGKRIAWPSPLPPMILFPKAPNFAKIAFEEQDPSRILPTRVLIYEHVSLGLYRFKEERDK